MAKPSRKTKIRRFVLERILEEPKGVAAAAASKFSVSREYANKILRELVAEGVITATGSTRARTYELVTEKHRKRYRLGNGLEEDRVWREFVRPHLEGIGDRALEICHYGLTEMVNNAIEHSEGDRLAVSVQRNAARVSLHVADNGIGAFRKIREAFDLEDEEHAVLELTKGKLTTDPARHTGEGIFFTSRMFDSFAMGAGHLSLVHTPGGDWLVEDEDKKAGLGTGVLLRIDPNTTRTAKSVYDKFTSEDGEFAFDVTHIPVALARYGEENLISRSQAKRLLARVNLFRRVILDFSDVDTIGQAFADEVFRVFAIEHPEVELLPANTSPAVKAMIMRAQAAAAQRAAS